MSVLHTVSSTSVEISIETEDSPVAGQMYVLDCIVTYPDGLSNPVEVQWKEVDGLNASGEAITVVDPVVSGTTITTSIIFEPLRVVHERKLICEATVMSVAPPFLITKTAEVDIGVERTLFQLMSVVSVPANCKQSSHNNKK